MILGSPPFEPTPMPMYRHPLLQAHAHVRSRSTSSGSVPASPVTVARALGRHTTPPPFLQRKLFNGMNEDEGSGSTSSGSDRGGTRDLTVMEEYEAEDEMAGVGLGLRSSGSAEEGRGVIRRAVSRKPNLLVRPPPTYQPTRLTTSNRSPSPNPIFVSSPNYEQKMDPPTSSRSPPKQLYIVSLGREQLRSPRSARLPSRLSPLTTDRPPRTASALLVPPRIDSPSRRMRRRSTSAQVAQVVRMVRRAEKQEATGEG